jgi:hypothetical protein
MARLGHSQSEDHLGPIEKAGEAHIRPHLPKPTADSARLGWQSALFALLVPDCRILLGSLSAIGEAPGDWTAGPMGSSRSDTPRFSDCHSWQQQPTGSGSNGDERPWGLGRGARHNQGRCWACGLATLRPARLSGATAALP